MKTFMALAIGTMCALAPLSAAAQNDPPAQSAPAAQGDDAIVVTGIRDRALDAFLRGDFVAAEEEFRDNLRCIQRVERELLAGLSGGSPQNLGQPPYIYNMPASVDRIAERTCHSPEWQHYMVGLSQLQQGELQEARHSLTRAARSHDELMFDAHFRIGLIDLLNGDVDQAERALARLRALQRNCDSRGTRCHVHADLGAAASYLRAAIREARRAS